MTDTPDSMEVENHPPSALEQKAEVEMEKPPMVKTGDGEPEAEHPDAPRVRQQVEYYFSDENLPTDLHLLQCCGGRENLPVSISRIRGFKKMRQFKNKKMVVDALRKSAFLTVTEDGKGIKRKIPLIGKCLLDPDFHSQDSEDDEIAYDPRTKRPIQHPVPLISQAKKGLPPGVSKAMLKPTGFEDGYVEGPLPPAEAEEEEAMYDPGKPFIERIELAIQRFKQKRRMHEIYAKVFAKWMKFGGVDNDPKIFGGLSRQEMKSMNAEEIARATATYVVPWDRTDESKWDVDFLGVAEGFLSSYYPDYFGYDRKSIKTASQVLRSFFQYLLFHRVCPEYQNDLLLARAICDKAEQELPLVDAAGLLLPGEFNQAASTIFGGHHANTYAGNAEWLTEEERESFADCGMRKEQALITFKTAVAIYGTDEQFDLLERSGQDLAHFKTIKSEELNLQIVRKEASTPEFQKYYDQQNKQWKDKLVLHPLGKLICQIVTINRNEQYDLPDGVQVKPSRDAGDVIEFWIEDKVLDGCFEGMKMSAVVNTITGGFVVLDQVQKIMCSFYKWLPNELWMMNKPKALRIIKKGMFELEAQKAKDATDGKEGGAAEDQVEQGGMSDDSEG
ncbi:hypothetical protein BU24DRAFT_496872 [Aaosphaeria arxii CBS 175.79]|uniref:HTH La-type RNA-binding domain-containing protein n=1 Tax=Aaosphaeria arxii CBS 175.79 TaxID=1450172 RepID=A0A6A5XAZ4_9PLEO|nr:uncharacterized protein BU24DRAFT_496872 [Aaosphaeria arxii CBS 175.79]KAF2010079.1 hypothetical protein BU24DRAFT_496872 [Aaosphaeria arxii CBS 175.79]